MRATSKTLAVCGTLAAIIHLPSATLAVTTPNLEVDKTVILSDTGTCPGVDPLHVAPNTNVKYCYSLTNNTNNTTPITYTTHSLVDDVAGTIFGPTSTNPPVPNPGQTIMVTSTPQLIQKTTLNTGTWTAMTGTTTDMATDTALVCVCGDGMVDPQCGETCDAGPKNGFPTGCCDTNCQKVNGGDTDGDGICDNTDLPGNGTNGPANADPSGYFYSETNGLIVPGGNVAVTCIANCSGVTGITVTESGATGRYTWVVNFTSTSVPAATFQLATTAPALCHFSTSCLETLTPPLGFQVGATNPTVIGSGLNGTMSGLANFTCGANPFYRTMTIGPNSGDAINNNFPLVCGTSTAPTLSPWGLAAAILALIAVGLYTLRRRQAWMQ